MHNVYGMVSNGLMILENIKIGATVMILVCYEIHNAHFCVPILYTFWLLKAY